MNIELNWIKSNNSNYAKYAKGCSMYSKYSIFDNQLTIGENQFLREYNVTMAYNKSFKSLFQHECYIYIRLFYKEVK